MKEIILDVDIKDYLKNNTKQSTIHPELQE